MCPLLGVKQPDFSYKCVLKVKTQWREKMCASREKGRAFIYEWVHNVQGTKQCFGRYQCFAIQGSHDWKKISTSAMVFFVYKQIKIKLNSVHLLLLFLPTLFVSLFSCMVMCMMFGSLFAFIWNNFACNFLNPCRAERLVNVYVYASLCMYKEWWILNEMHITAILSCLRSPNRNCEYLNKIELIQNVHI